MSAFALLNAALIRFETAGIDGRAAITAARQLRVVSRYTYPRRFIKRNHGVQSLLYRKELRASFFADASLPPVRHNDKFNSSTGMKSRVSGAHFTVGAGLVLAFAAIISSVDCQGPDQGSTPIPHLTLNGSILLNNTRIQLSEVGIDSTAALRCVTDLSTCCNNGSHSGRWVAVDQSGDFYQQRLVAGGVELHHVEAFAVGNYRCEIDTAASIARGGPRDVLYVSIFEGGVCA